LGGSGNFKRWDLVGESKSLGHDLEGYIWSPVPLVPSSLLSAPRWSWSEGNLTTCSHCHDVLLKCRGPSIHGLSSLKPWAKQSSTWFGLVVEPLEILSF
jgi:hypothetical protein